MYKKSKDEQRLELAWREFEQKGEILNNAEGVLIASEAYMHEVGRLFEENKRLWEFVKKVAELEIETFHFETQGGDEDFIEYICTDIVDDANDLLSSLDSGAQGSSAKQEFKPLDFVEIGRLEK